VSVSLSQADLPQLQDEIAGLGPVDVMQWATTRFPGNAVFASSMGIEDQVIMDMVCRDGLEIPAFTLDTGRLFQETYDLIEATESRYGTKIKIYFPDATEVETMVAENGVNLFYHSTENRKRCCGVRKLRPLARALSGAALWVCGLRREQSSTRADMGTLEWDANNTIFKLNPLMDWSEDDVRAYVKANNVPYNPLHDQGFVSIGCASCSRAIKPGESFRAGRWWWEEEEHKECGLHWVDGKLVRPALAGEGKDT
jgi:phosphoadenosine phosphosulfate reductase